MDCCSSLLSEEQVSICSICLDLFTAPVTIPCGHNFCKVCISNYWATTTLRQCPLCKSKFNKLHKLHVNTTLRDLVENVKKTKDRDDEESARPGEVPCDVCTGRKLRALKSCLVCQTSYCETHLEPHQRVAGLKKHQLIDPVENLEARMCEKHDKMFKMFCKTDQMYVCRTCMDTDHKAHDAVPFEEECGQRKGELRKMTADTNQMMKTRSMKVQQIKLSLEASKKDADNDILHSVEVFTALLSSIERRQYELIRVIEEKQKATEKQAEGFVKELEEEITELKGRGSELQQLSRSEDHLHVLQRLTSLSTPPPTKDWSQVSVQASVSVMGAVRRAVSQLEDTLTKEIKWLCELDLKRFQQYAVDVTLDPDTASHCTILSEDGKQVRFGEDQIYLSEENLPDNPKRFHTRSLCVLGKQGFSSGKFYYEVQVEGETWHIGVARESITRKEVTFNHPGNGFWTIYLVNGEYKALEEPRVLLSPREEPKKVGVFVDYEGGEISFFNVHDKSLLYSFKSLTFTEKLYPYLCPSNRCDAAPLIITPVTHTD